MLASLLNTPVTQTQWFQFAWDHRDSHDRIRAAIRTKYRVDQVDYQIEPINPIDLKQFLNNNSSLHDAMNAQLHLTSSDLSDVDFKNENQFKAWIALHYQEHLSAERALGI